LYRANGWRFVSTGAPRPTTEYVFPTCIV